MQYNSLEDLVLSEKSYQTDRDIEFDLDEHYTNFVRAVLEFVREPLVSAKINTFVSQMKLVTTTQGTPHEAIIPNYDAYVLNTVECKFTEFFVYIIKALVNIDKVDKFDGFAAEDYKKSVKDILTQLEDTSAYKESMDRVHSPITWANHLLNSLHIAKADAARSDNGLLTVLPHLAAYAKQYNIKINLLIRMKQLYYHTSYGLKQQKAS
jgi:hypothetical protein